MVLLALAIRASSAESEPGRIDLTNAVVVVPDNLDVHEQKAVQMLVEEVAKRTQITWSVAHTLPDASIPAVLVGTRADLHRILTAIRADVGPRNENPEGYVLAVSSSSFGERVIVVGNDDRGVLFGVGRLLRNLHMGRRSVHIDEHLKCDSSPHSQIRGHQLGYRPKTNSYDGWDLHQWEQYFRDLAVFGANSVELIPPRSDDDADSPMFPAPPMETMIGMSKLLDEYGMDCWIWYPAMDSDYSNPNTVEAALHEWGEVFRQLPRVDAVFVPGGDPGHTEPKYLMALLEKEAQVLRTYHPKAQMWVAPQGFNKVWFDEFMEIIRKEPEWLTGIVFGPQVRVSAKTLREIIPKRYPIRHYPDITHSKECEYPPANWDLAFAFTEGREGINPRPVQEAEIFHSADPYTIGSISYSEGCNDDVNKAVWSALEWDPNVDVREALREYARYFIDDRYTDTFADGLLELEQNWQAPLITNAGVTKTLERFQKMEREATPFNKLNWRFQQALYRAYYDAFLQARLRYEQGLEHQANELLAKARETGSLAAMDAAQHTLDLAVTQRTATDLRQRIFELAEALFQSIKMQLSVKKYYAIGFERGANLDGIDLPLNNRVWLKSQFAKIRELPDESDRLKRLDEIVHWTDPGPGGFYDALGDPTRQPHLVHGPSFAQDPGCYETNRVGFSDLLGRWEWARHQETLYDTPLKMHYTGLDSKAAYRLRIVYGGDDGRKVRLVANDGIEIHPFRNKPSFQGKPLEFDVPRQATAGGELTLSWTRESGGGGNGRGCQVSEVWLMRRDAAR
jgi:hypothetical protein